MAFTIVPDKVAGDTISLSNWNTHIRDNLNRGIWRPVADTLLGSDAASITLSSISATDFDNLIVIVYCRCTGAAAGFGLGMRFNGDTGNNYDWQDIMTEGAVSTSSVTRATSSMQIGRIPGNTAPSGAFGLVVASIPDYAGTTFHKAARSHWSRKKANSANNLSVGVTSGFWRSASAINSITVIPASGDLVTGSRVTLIGANTV